MKNNKTNFIIKLLILYVLCFIIYLLYYKTHEGFFTLTTASPTYTGPSTTASPTYTGPSTTASPTYTGPSTTASPTYTGPSTTIPLTTYGYKDKKNKSSETEIYQHNFEGTSNIYSPSIYYNMERFASLNY